MNAKPANPILCAIDVADSAKAKTLVRELKGAVGGIKLGLEFFTANGPRAVRDVTQGLPLFLDLKLYDIPNTVGRAVSAVVALLEPMLLTVHCAGGPAMMKAAADAVKDEAARHGGRKARTKVVGVTVLTSLDESDLEAIGQKGPVGDQVKRLALLAKDSSLDGIICSPHEVAELRGIVGPDFLLVVPGIRVGSLGHGDQKRVMGPRDAVQAGADYLVIGRPITGSPSPPAAARAMLAEIRKP